MGRDVAVAITTEHKALGVKVASNAVSVAGIVGSLVDSTTLIKNREWPNDEDGSQVAVTFDAVSTDYMSIGSITTPDGAATVTITFSNSPAAGDEVTITDGDGTTKTYTAHASSTSGLNFSRAGATSAAVDNLQTVIEAQGQNFTITQPTTTSLQLVSTNTDDSGIVLTGDDKNTLSDVTGIDVSLDKTDEDLTFFGQKTILNAEIKKGVSITLTRKKSDADYQFLFERARGGVSTFTSSTSGTLDEDSVTSVSGSTGVTANLTGLDNHTFMPSNGNYGYRVHLQMKEGTEVMSILNCCFQDYAVTTSADGITEESLTFYSYMDPVINTTANTTLSTAGIN